MKGLGGTGWRWRRASAHLPLAGAFVDMADVRAGFGITHSAPASDKSEAPFWAPANPMRLVGAELSKGEVPR